MSILVAYEFVYLMFFNILINFICIVNVLINQSIN